MQTEFPAEFPATKKTELAKIVKIIQSNCDDVEMIILYGSYARGDYKEAKDLKPGRKSGHVSDYDILVVTRNMSTALNGKIWTDIEEICHEEGIKIPVGIVAHDIFELNHKLGEEQYFFTDIKREGIVLFDSQNFELENAREFTPQEKQENSQKHFDHWFESAKDFFRSFNHDMKDERYKIASFHLHQTAEACYKTILLVFTNYSPDEHRLVTLRRMSVDQFYPIDKALRYRTDEEDRLFKLLDYAYIGARYDPEYRIKKQEIEVLGKEIEKLLEIVEVGCEWKIEKMGE